MLLNCGVGEDPWESLGLKRSNQLTLKKINPEYSLEGLMLKLKLQYFGHLIWRTDSFEKTLMLGKIEAEGEGDRGWDGWMASLTQWTWVWASSGSWWWTGQPGVLQSTGSQRVGHDWATELNCSCVLVAKSCLILASPRTKVHQAPLSMGFSRQEYWSGLPFPSSGDLPDPGIEPQSPALAGRFFTTEPTNFTKGHLNF